MNMAEIDELLKRKKIEYAHKIQEIELQLLKLEKPSFNGNPRQTKHQRQLYKTREFNSKIRKRTSENK